MLMKGQYECNFCNGLLKRKIDLLKHMQKCKVKNENRKVKKKIQPRDCASRKVLQKTESLTLRPDGPKNETTKVIIILTIMIILT